MKDNSSASTNSHRFLVLMPGFGCNSKIFEKLQLPVGTIVNLEWITPTNNEPIQSYADRLITDEMRVGAEVILIGHSFGGVIVQEIARIIPVKQIILISSITSNEGLSKGLNLVRNLRLDIWVHKFTMKGTFWMWGKSSGLKDEMKPIFMESFNNIENKYYRWAVKNLAGWEQTLPNDLSPILIHGSEDTVFPIERAQNPIVVENGGHLMVYFKAEEISKILKEIIIDEITIEEKDTNIPSE